MNKGQDDYRVTDSIRDAFCQQGAVVDAEKKDEPVTREWIKGELATAKGEILTPVIGWGIAGVGIKVAFLIAFIVAMTCIEDKRDRQFKKVEPVSSPGRSSPQKKTDLLPHDAVEVEQAGPNRYRYKLVFVGQDHKAVVLTMLALFTSVDGDWEVDHVLLNHEEVDLARKGK